MKTTLEYYDIFPKVLCTKSPSTVTIRALGEHTAFDGYGRYRVKLVPMNNTLINRPGRVYQTVDAVCEEGVLRFSCRLSGEQQYAVLLQ